MLYQHLNSWWSKFFTLTCVNSFLFFHGILVYNKTLEKHDEHLQLTLTIFGDHKFYVKDKKYFFIYCKVKFLCHLVSTRGVKVDNKRLKLMPRWPFPYNIKELRKLLRPIRCYFIISYISVIGILIKLIKKDNFIWTYIK